MRKTYWLASYPKSGNTWFRMLVANLRRDTPVDINDIPERSGIASARAWFDSVMMFPSSLLTHEECDRLRPMVYEALAQEVLEDDPEEAETMIGHTRFVKTHDSYTYNPDGGALLAGIKGADGAILIVRDPRDVAPSLANHNRTSIDDAIGFMADAGSAFCGHRDRQPNQLRQQLAGWSGFIQAWLAQTDIPVHLVRYEDMHADTGGMLRTALAFAGIDATHEETARAAGFAEFGELKKQEEARGFREAPRPKAGAGPGSFFRRGVSGGWRDELSTEQVARIERDHAPMMARLGYAPARDMTERMAG
ncbi:sulfotransferase domain-containing protein [Sphingomonas sp. So64.6b]|uniref:sulfotransferase domain-containing protein n=1 Tax=Sphingomonas sp. So64.6b TaxID=2997354 RepID=UPI0016025390|nr:sulfotransferase domain-containing protein [Sphingomonas sp. So64.6b]QNA84368.1 sulfotransferase domain-containing protein [Sphingomonas sp. So64.6b]